MLHGISLSHITSGAKAKAAENEEKLIEETENISPSSSSDDEFDDGPNDENQSCASDEVVPAANDSVHRRLNTHRSPNNARNEDAMSRDTAGSASADSYDVIGELSINPNSVEETLVRIWDNDVQLSEVRKVSLFSPDWLQKQ